MHILKYKCECGTFFSHNYTFKRNVYAFFRQQKNDNEQKIDDKKVQTAD